MVLFIKIIFGVSLCTVLSTNTNALLQYGHVRLPCNHRKQMLPLILRRMAEKRLEISRSHVNNENRRADLVDMSDVSAPLSEFEDRTEEFAEENKALRCAQLPCSAEELGSPVCACNHVTGRVATFKNDCDLKRHNCRYDTAFKMILQEICPWEYQYRRSAGRPLMDYSDPKYYN